LGDAARAKGDFREAAKYYSRGLEAVKDLESGLTDDLVRKRNDMEQHFKSKKPDIGWDI
jgi:hypothetical protein